VGFLYFPSQKKKRKKKKGEFYYHFNIGKEKKEGKRNVLERSYSHFLRKEGEKRKKGGDFLSSYSSQGGGKKGENFARDFILLSNF